ncbi:MAG: ASCH domain-containing protein [Candidatus Paceibacterota bacterium]|jgi:ASC-1-like (ASCH) protein
MNYELNLNDRPFQAIKAGTKKIEGRTPNDGVDLRYKKMSPGDFIIFINNTTNEKLTCAILSITHYPNVKSMLEAEGTQNVLSSGRNIEEGIESYNNLGDYKERIGKYGIYAIGIKLEKD